MSGLMDSDWRDTKFQLETHTERESRLSLVCIKLSTLLDFWVRKQGAPRSWKESGFCLSAYAISAQF